MDYQRACGGRGRGKREGGGRISMQRGRGEREDGGEGGDYQISMQIRRMYNCMGYSHIQCTL